MLGLIATGLVGLPSAVAAPAAPEMMRTAHDGRLDVGADDTTWRTIVVDGDDVQRRDSGTPFNVFVGFGTVSCNNTGKQLLD